MIDSSQYSPNCEALKAGGIKKSPLAFFLFLFLSQIVSISYADDAAVLPKGIARVRVDSLFYFPIDERFNPEGDVENVAVDYNKNLNSNVFRDLTVVESFFEMRPGSASIGKSIVSFEYDFTIVNSQFDYGLTDKLTVGVLIPYWWVKNNVNARLDTSSATVGRNPNITVMLVPLWLPETVRLTTGDVQNLLGRGLDINRDGKIDIRGFGYKRVGTWSNSGVSDIETGFRYQYLKTADWRLAFTGGVRFPTGEVDDPDNLVDYSLGKGAYALLFRLNNDYTGIENLLLNATVRYDLLLPDEEVQRVPDDVNLPITLNKEKVERNLGDVFELELSGKYTFPKGFDLSLLYKYGFKLKDDISGNKGFAYESLEEETDWTEHVFIACLSYSTVPLYMEKKFPVPLTASLSYRNRFAGSNNVLKSQYIALGLQVFF